MKYLVLEIQANADGSVGIPPVVSYDNKNAAENKFHTILAYAAVSEVPMHSAVLMTTDGKIIKRESYTHGTNEENN